MNPDHAPPRREPLRGAAALARLTAIAAVVAAGVGGFTWFAGVLGGRGLSARAIIDTLQGPRPHAGFRRNHAKGICVSGWFDGNGAASRDSRAGFFARQRASVIGRFAEAGPNPYVPDGSAAVRSLALQLTLPDGEQWRTGMNDIPFFPVATPAGFEAQLRAQQPDPETGKPDPAAMSAFIAAHPQAAALGQALKTMPRATDFGSDTYNSVNAFILRDALGGTHAVRWSLRPEQVADPQALADDPNARFERLLQQLDAGPLRWHLMLTLAQPGDAVDDASQPWPADRPTIDAGTLTLTHASGEDVGGCRDIVYDPLVLPDGIEASNDPLLSARSAAYAVSYRRRAGEPPGDSALAGQQAGTHGEAQP
ncbi:catalase family peroxidase [Solimonas marina]|uniref:Catalase-related peroxidase n=1 Tax=Solimonas marina TaxID=2714601 RepID=A0A969WG08_9GAMM|nr:catalase family peroxidase [Solimonas marina]NKF24616.1 catalase family peroxidase [Solimonas marina]